MASLPVSACVAEASELRRAGVFQGGSWTKQQSRRVGRAGGRELRCDTTNMWRQWRPSRFHQPLGWTSDAAGCRD